MLICGEKNHISSTEAFSAALEFSLLVFLIRYFQRDNHFEGQLEPQKYCCALFSWCIIIKICLKLELD